VKIQAETSSGKSLAFLVPLIQMIAKQKSQNGETSTAKNSDFNKPWAIVIEPARELAIQLDEQCRKLTEGIDVSVSTCFGGQGKHSYQD
jgi:superfamily II DNA/RNA helicase